MFTVEEPPPKLLLVMVVMVVVVSVHTHTPLQNTDTDACVGERHPSQHTHHAHDVSWQIWGGAVISRHQCRRKIGPGNKWR